MGHSTNHYVEKATTEKALKNFIARITGNAYDPNEACCYHGNITIHKNKVYSNYAEAMKAIESYDDGWYSDHVVLFYDISNEGRKKIEDWNQKRDKYIEQHSIHKRTSKYAGCPFCGSKISIGHLRGEKCPVCGTDLRPESTIEKIKWYDQKAKECAKKYKEKYWLAKIEYHC